MTPSTFTLVPYKLDFHAMLSAIVHKILAIQGSLASVISDFPTLLETK